MKIETTASPDRVAVRPQPLRGNSPAAIQNLEAGRQRTVGTPRRSAGPVSGRIMAIAFGCLVASVLSSPLHAGTFVTWDASTDPKGITASADGVNVSVVYNPATFSQKDPSQSSINMSGSNYNPPGSASQSFIDVQQDIGMTWTFDQPVEDLLLYLVFWRGIGLGGPPDGNYTFDQTPTIQSGLAGGTINGNSFVVTSNESFYSGILSFPGQLTSLSLLTPATGNAGGNGYTMSFTAVPEPATTVILLGAGGVLALLRCHRRR